MSGDGRDLGEWLKISKDWEGSILSQAEYCKLKGLSPWRFTESRTKLMAQGLLKPCYKQRKSKPEPMRFIPVNLSGKAASPKWVAPEGAGQAFIEIHLPHGIVLRIPTC